MPLFLGYDPGGNEKHGVCVLEFNEKQAELKIVACKKEPTVNDVLKEIEKYNIFKAAGIDTFTTWSSGISGWRASDLWLRNRYKELSSSVLSSNSTSGSMCINGALVGKCLLDNNKTEKVTETHPKVGFPVLIRKANALTADSLTGLYNYEQPCRMLDKLSTALSNSAGLSLPLNGISKCADFTDHHFDALFSAVVACLSTLPKEEGGWAENLHEGCEMECLSYPFGEKGKVIYAWPEKPDYEEIHC